MRLEYPNLERQAFCLERRNDFPPLGVYTCRMGKPEHDWYLKEWMRLYDKRQVDLVSDLGWNKSKASLMASGRQPYTRKEVNEVAFYLNLHPYELLMHPEDAMGIRQIRGFAARIAGESNRPDDDAGEASGGKRHDRFDVVGDDCAFCADQSRGSNHSENCSLFRGGK